MRNSSQLETQPEEAAFILPEPKVTAVVSLSDLYGALIECSGGVRFTLDVPPELVEALLPMRKRIESRFADCLVDGGSRKAMGKLVKLPTKVDKARWIAANMLEHLLLINQLFLIVSKECSPESCPEMSASMSIRYAWGDGDSAHSKTSTQQYISLMNQWINGLFQQGLFPSQGAYSKRSFFDVVLLIQRKSFRVFCHIYFAHWKYIQVFIFFLFHFHI
jgi:hypothetical protein